MFKRSRRKRKDSSTANERLVKKIIGKDSGRKVFGFPCSPGIKASLKSLSGQIHVDLYALAEHALQLGAMQIADANNNPEEREVLRRHLTEVHVEMRTIEKVAKYDADAAEVLKLERIRRFQIEKAVRQIVEGLSDLASNRKKCGG